LYDEALAEDEIRMEFGNDSKMARLYDEALAEDKRRAEPGYKAYELVEDGKIYLEIGNFQEALRCFTGAIELGDKTVETLTWRGETYREMRNYDEAIFDFTHAIRMDPNYICPLVRNAWIFRELKDTKSFTENLSSALSIMNHEALDDHYNRATAFILDNRIPDAMGELEKAFKNNYLDLLIFSEYDDLLDPIRDLPEFKALLAKYR
jgi:tetratricopeptide (TPR) repeat protein